MLNHSSPSPFLLYLSFIMPRTRSFSWGNFIKWKYECFFPIQICRMHSIHKILYGETLCCIVYDLLFKSCLMKYSIRGTQFCQWTNGYFLKFSFSKIFNFPFSSAPYLLSQIQIILIAIVKLIVQLL